MSTCCIVVPVVDGPNGQIVIGLFVLLNKACESGNNVGIIRINQYPSNYSTPELLGQAWLPVLKEKKNDIEKQHK